MGIIVSSVVNDDDDHPHCLKRKLYIHPKSVSASLSHGNVQNLPAPPMPPLGWISKGIFLLHGTHSPSLPPEFNYLQFLLIPIFPEQHSWDDEGGEAIKTIRTPSLLPDLELVLLCLCVRVHSRLCGVHVRYRWVLNGNLFFTSPLSPRVWRNARWSSTRWLAHPNRGR